MKRIIRTSAFTNGFYNKDRFLISLFFLLGIGMLIGAVSAGNNASSENSILYQIYSSYNQAKSEQSYVQLFLNSFISEFAYLFVCYVVGLCAIGTPVIFIIPLIYGIGKGIIFGFLYVKNGLLGIFNIILFSSVQNVGLLLVIIVALKKSYKMSRQIFKNLFSDNSLSNGLTFKKYNHFYLLILLISIALCLIDALMFKINVFN